MEYTKDIILHVNYGQGEKVNKKYCKWLWKIASVITNHKVITAVLSITVMLMFLDIILVTSFVQVLSNINL